MMHARKFLICAFLPITIGFLTKSGLIAQPTYPMQNAVVRDCEGILTHSEAGEDKNYDHNEDFTFTICVPGATSITLDFEFFATERTYDLMTIYEGPNKNGPVISTLSGILNPPPRITVKGDCVTIHFKSDDNITANGWKMHWKVQFVLPPPPTLKVTAPTACPLTELTFEFGYPVPCDQIIPGNFSLLGPGGSKIIFAEALDCVNGKATKFKLQFDPPLDRPVNYRVSFTYKYIDECGTEHLLNTSVLFSLNNCPFTVEILMPMGAACKGACTDLEAMATGNAKQKFRYRWLPGGQTSPSIRVCDTVPMQYRVIAIDSASGVMDTADFLYTPLDIPKILNPISDTVCASAADWKYQIDIPGGDFFSRTIPNQHRKTGIYEFWRHAAGNKLSTDTVVYIAPNGCKVSDIVHIYPIDAGADIKLCLGSPAIQISGGTPAGGYWTGPGIQPNGSFDPSVVGQFDFIYTAPNGCSDIRSVFVHPNPRILNPVPDTVCASMADWRYQVSIPKGDFYSSVIPSSQRKSGIYEFWRLSSGDTLRSDTVTYIDPNGCQVRDTFMIIPVSAGSTQSVCHLTPVFKLTGGSPMGGFWSGPYTDSLGNFNPQDTGSFIVTYHSTNGCSAKKSVRVNANPIILNPIADTICASAANWQYQVNLPGGTYSATAIPAAQNKSGIYEFWRWAQANQTQRDIVTYTAPGGCTIKDTFYIHPVFAGLVEAACQGSMPFQLSGGRPTGGFWTGSNVDSSGIFNPIKSGSYTLNYKAPNGCISSKTVNVADSIGLNLIDTLCNLENINLVFTPVGGRWSGPGITDSIAGKLDATKAIANQWNTYRYRLNGCEKNISVFITKPDAGPDTSLCLGVSTLNLPLKGRWSGPGVYDPLTNTFDISSLTSGIHSFKISFKNCRDSFKLNIHDVRLDSSQSRLFCPAMDTIDLVNLLNPSEGPGIFSGTGVAYPDSLWKFLPTLAGPGKHDIVYKAFGCVDTIDIEVEIPISFSAYKFCDRSPPTVLKVIPSGGEWSGTGFLDESAGLFDPELSGLGIHPVIYTSPAGCKAQALVEVEAWEQVRIGGIDPQYCFKNQDIPVLLNPSGGEFFINGLPSAPIINPARLGSGIWELYYTRGEGNCASSEKTFIKILPAIHKKSSSENDSICIGQRATISIDASGGQGGLIYTWDHGLGFGSSHIVEPVQDSWFLVTVTDGCSDPLVDSVFIRVFPRFPMDTISGPPVCFGEKTFLELKLDTADYEIVWQTSPQKKGARLDGDPGIYGVEIKEKSTGCRQRTTVTLPGSAPLAANFGLTPNQPCIDIVENTVEILDLSFGYTDGTIDFGDGSPLVDIKSPGSLVHQYSDTGNFVIKMHVINDIGCEDEFEREVCVKNVVRIFIPSLFSPNNDGKQDIFEIFHIGVEILHWAVYDRYGARVFESKDGMDKWDGTFRGMHVVEGVYVVVIEYFNPDKGKKEIFISDVTILR